MRKLLRTSLVQLHLDSTGLKWMRFPFVASSLQDVATCERYRMNFLTRDSGSAGSPMTTTSLRQNRCSEAGATNSRKFASTCSCERLHAGTEGGVTSTKALGRSVSQIWLHYAWTLLYLSAHRPSADTSHNTPISSSLMPLLTAPLQERLD